jgi:hypothetical protein
VKNCSAADQRPTTAHKESSKGSAHEWAVFRACHFGGQALRPHEGARCTQGAPGRRRGQSWHRRPNVPANGVSQPKKGRSGDGVEPGHTTRPRNRSKSAHAVEFSKTVAPLRMGFPFQWGTSAGTDKPVPPERTEEYSARSWPRRSAVPPALAAVYEITWTVTVRLRGRSSKSISTTCCHVPSTSRPSRSGIDSDGPISAARRCAWAFVSWLRRLCS